MPRPTACAKVSVVDLLCPLKHPSELGVHPSLSEPYLSPALPDMIKTTEEKLRQEKANLWRAKNVSRQVLGDMAWLPCGAIESQDDSNLFEPARRRADASRAKKRKLGRDSIPVDAAAIDMTATETATTHDQEGAGVPQTESDARMTNGTADTARHNENREHEHATKEEAESMQRRARLAATAVGRDAETHDQATTMNHETGASLLKGKGSADVDQDRQRLIDGLTQGENEEVRQPPGQEPDTEEVKKLAERENEEGQETPPPPPRRVTRALAATNGSNPESANITPPDSPTSIASEGSSSSLLQIDPLYLLPNELHPSFSSVVIPGVPLDEFMDIRRLLTTYIQKQEESVRGYESVLSKLRKAYRLRKSVLKMCKAEGHVGEVSDGEDWIDLDYWGLKQGDLKKGKDEDEDAVEEATIGGRKGKRRARN